MSRVGSVWNLHPLRAEQAGAAGGMSCDGNQVPRQLVPGTELLASRGEDVLCCTSGAPYDRALLNSGKASSRDFATWRSSGPN